MCPPTCPRTISTRIVITVAALCLAISVLFAQEPQPPAKPKDLTPEQQEKLKERDRLSAEVEKLRKEEKWVEAIAAGEKQLVIEREVWGELHDDVVASLNQLAGMHEEREDWPAVKKQREEEVLIQPRRFGKQDWRAGDARPALGDCEGLVRLTPEGRRELKEAERLDDEMERLYGQSKYREAAGICHKILVIRKKVLGPEHPHTATSLMWLGFLLQAQGDYASARPHIEQALSIRIKALGSEHPHTARSLNDLGYLLQAQGDYAGARPYFEQVLAICRTVFGPEHLQTATSLNNLAGLLRNQKDYRGASERYKEVLAIRTKVLGTGHPDTASCLCNLADLMEEEKKLTEAAEYYNEALNVYTKVLGKGDPKYSAILNRLSTLNAAQGKGNAAETHYKEALAIVDSLTRREEVINPGMGTPGMQTPGMDPPGATSVAGGASQPRSASDWGAFDLEDYEQAALLCREHSRNIRSNLELSVAGQSERAQLAMCALLRPMFDHYLSLSGKANLPNDETYDEFLLWKGMVYARQRILRRVNSDTALASVMSELRSLNSRLGYLICSAPDSDASVAVDEWRKQIQSLNKRKEDLESSVTPRKVGIRRLLEQGRVSCMAVQKAIPSDCALVDMLEYTAFEERRLIAIVVRSDKPVRRVELGPVAPIAKNVSDWRMKTATDDVAAMNLRKLLWEPLEPHLDGIKTVLISPDGAPASLPWGALPGRKPNTYLIEEVAIAVIPVPQLLAESLVEKKEPTANSLLAVGEVDYGATQEGAKEVAQTQGNRQRSNHFRRFGRLNATAAEIAAIQRRFKQTFTDGSVQEFFEAKATEAAIKESAPKFRYLHLATHGFFASAETREAIAAASSGAREGDSQPRLKRPSLHIHPGFFCGLVLAGANQPPKPLEDDGILTAIEVADLDLTQVELVTLSACETGLGEVAGGEGMLGLQRAFQIAGAKSVVGSLWKVDDKATQQLMIDFYDNLWQRKMSKAEALRQAQLSMLREGAKRGLTADDKPADKYKKLPPYYWAGFVLSGDWR